MKTMISLVLVWTLLLNPCLSVSVSHAGSLEAETLKSIVALESAGADPIQKLGPIERYLPSDSMGYSFTSATGLAAVLAIITWIADSSPGKGTGNVAGDVSVGSGAAFAAIFFTVSAVVGGISSASYNLRVNESKQNMVAAVEADARLQKIMAIFSVPYQLNTTDPDRSINVTEMGALADQVKSEMLLKNTDTNQQVQFSFDDFSGIVEKNHLVGDSVSRSVKTVFALEIPKDLKIGSMDQSIRPVQFAVAKKVAEFLKAEKIGARDVAIQQMMDVRLKALNRAIRTSEI